MVFGGMEMVLGVRKWFLGVRKWFGGTEMVFSQVQFDKIFRKFFLSNETWWKTKKNIKTEILKEHKYPAPPFACR